MRSYSVIVVMLLLAGMLGWQRTALLIASGTVADTDDFTLYIPAYLDQLARDSSHLGTARR